MSPSFKTEVAQQGAFIHFISVYYPFLARRDPLAAAVFERKYLNPEAVAVLADTPYRSLRLRLCKALPARILEPIKDRLGDWAFFADGRSITDIIRILVAKCGLQVEILKHGYGKLQEQGCGATATTAVCRWT